MNAKAILLLLLSCPLFLTEAAAQRKVNETCKADSDCERSCKCLTTVNGKKCATCDQSTLARLTGEVNENCKADQDGWAPEKSPEYIAVTAADQRVEVGVYDVMIDKAKACKAARIDRENKCWKGGDAEHKNSIAEVEQGISNLATHKYRMIQDKRVYYSTFPVYRSRLNDYMNKCDKLKITDLRNYLEGYKKKIKAGTKISCSEAEGYQRTIGYGYDAAADLMSDCFKNNISIFPNEYRAKLEAVKELKEEYKSMLDDARAKKLCN